MNLSALEKVDGAIVKFLSDQGVFPAIKDREDEIANLEDELYRKLRRLQTGVESAFIQKLRERGYVPGNSAEQNALLEMVFSLPFTEMIEVIVNLIMRSAETGRQLTIDDLNTQGMEVSFTSFSEQVSERLRNKFYTFSEDTFNRIKGDFKETLATAYEEGKGIDETARRLRADFADLRDHRLHKIARTEVQGAQNEGINQTMEDFNVAYKQWLTVHDHRVRGIDPTDRFDHISLHGEVVEFSESFSNGLAFPLDRRGAIGNWINCRCRMRPYIPSRNEHITTTPYYPA